MDLVEIDEIAIALVKEYLSSKELKASLACLDNEKPRSSKSIYKRSVLIKALHVEKLYKRNKEQRKPFQSIMEVIVKHFLDCYANGVCLTELGMLPNEKNRLPSKVEPSLGGVSQSSDSEVPSSDGSFISSGLPSGHSLRTPEGRLLGQKTEHEHQSKHVSSTPTSGNDHVHIPVTENQVNVTGHQTEFDLVPENSPETQQDDSSNSNFSLSSFQSRMMPNEDVAVVDLDEEDLAQGILISTQTSPPVFTLSGTWITGAGAKEIKSLMFGKSSNFNEEWKMQNFSFSETDGLKFGIVQKKGGPCGVLACLQSYVLRELIFPDEGISIGLNPSAKEQDQALIAAISRVVWKAGQEEKAVIAVPKRQNKESEGKTDNITESLMLYELATLEDVQNCVAHHLKVFKEDGNLGCISFLYSAVLSRGIENVRSDMDESEGRLVGAHGYCTQEMVNLLLTGKAVSNVFDGILELDSGGSEKSILHGIESQSEIGFLSLFEHYDSCKVGENLKNPMYPIWVVCSESHFTVLFSTSMNVASPENELEHFTLHYYDGFGQDCEIRLLIDINSQQKIHVNRSLDDYRTPPLEHCIHTKWPKCTVQWEGCEPLL